MATHGHRLREKIRDVEEAANVLNPELKAANPILKPVKAHVAGLRHLGLDCAIGQTHSDFIVTMNRCGRLRVAEVGEHLALLICDLGGCERAPILRFLNGRTHHGNTCGVNGDGGIEEGGVVAAPQVMM